MKATKPYRPRPGETQPNYLTCVTIRHSQSTKRWQLNSGSEATLERSSSGAAGRYTFKYAVVSGDMLCLTFFGPSRRANRRYRTAWGSLDSDGAFTVQGIRRVHIKTAAPNTEEEEQ